MTTIARDESGVTLQALGLTGTSVRAAIAGTSSSTTLVDASTTVVRLVADTACFVRVAAAATTTTAAYLPAGVVEYFAVQPGQAVHVIGTSGFLYVTETS